jgi:hypothetical protein
MGVRRNQNKMTAAERARFVRALLRMKRDSGLAHNYDQYPNVHNAAFPSDVNLNPAHLGPAFCPWHRYFLARFEQDLQAADSLEGGDGRLMLPYWDWVNDNATTPNRQRGEIWHDDFMGGERSGHFADNAGWPTVAGGRLVRTFGSVIAELPRQAAVDLALASEGFDTFPFDSSPALEAGIASPAAPSLAAGGGGSLAAGVYRVVITYTAGATKETRPSPPTPATVAANGQITVTSPPARAGATGYKVYVSPVNGDARDARLESGTTAIGTATTIRSLSGGARRPATNTTSSFRNILEGWVSAGPDVDVHNRVHVWVGGSMLPGTSPDDPVFFMHHCNIDRLWAQWQHTHPGQNYPDVVPRVGVPGNRPHGLDDEMPPWNSGGERARPRDVLNHTTMTVRGRAAGYTYDTDPAVLALDLGP